MRIIFVVALSITIIFMLIIIIASILGLIKIGKLLRLQTLSEPKFNPEVHTCIGKYHVHDCAFTGVYDVCSAWIPKENKENIVFVTKRDDFIIFGFEWVVKEKAGNRTIEPQEPFEGVWGYRGVGRR